jgi:hypothetical protein
MTDDELRNEFTRVTTAEDGITLECCVITWPHPSQPASEWRVVKTLPAGSTPETLETARRALLQRRRFFRTCRLCDEHQPLGWMMDNGICQSCGSSRLGVVF